MITRFVYRFFLKPFEKKIKYQRFWKRLHAICLSGMNIGSGVDCNNSGERVAMRYVKWKLKGQQDIIIFDVGANVGLYTLELIKVFNMKKTTVYCFEPSSSAFRQLEAKTRNYENIHRHNTGIGEKDEEMVLYSDYKGSDLGSLYDLKTPFRPFAEKNAEPVQVRSIAGFCTEQGIKQIDFLKLDIEGHELKALAGAGDMLTSGAIRYIQFEFGPCNIDSRTFFRDYFFLLNDHYRIYRVLGDGLLPIDTYSQRDEIFLTGNYFAEFRGNKEK